MASKLPPVKNSGYTFRIVLFAQSDDQIKTTPTIAAGDFKVSTDGGTLANLGTLPTEGPASSGIVLITLSAAEMNGDEVVVTWIDAAGAEWHSGAAVIHTVASGQQFDNLSTFDETTATVDVGKISGDATAADNAESFFDGTGYAGTGNTIPTVTTLTGHTAQTADHAASIAAILADTGTDGVVISTATAQAIADEILARGAGNVEDTADAHSLAAIVLAILESSVSGTTWTIKKTDGATTFTTKTVTTDANADPITSVT